MKLSIILSTFLSNFATTAPNLCDIVYTHADGSPIADALGQTLARYCEWTGPDAPIWDGDVCCTIDDGAAACVAPDVNGRCPVGDRYFCEYGAPVAGYGVVCYQPFPSMCDVGLCIEAPEVPPPSVADLACCNEGGACQTIAPELIDVCKENGGYLFWCQDGVETTEGTLDCWD